MTERNDSRQGYDPRKGADQANAAWQTARNWQERARRARPSASMSGPRLFFTWLIFGVLMLVGTVLGLFFLLVGWLMLPLLRHRMKKRAEAFRARHAQNIGGNGDAHNSDAQHASDTTSRPGRQHVLEGDYEVRGEPAQDKPGRD